MSARDILASSIGTLLAAFLLTAVLYGFTLILLGQYFRSEFARLKDPLSVKCVVGSLGVLSTLQIIFLTYGMYQNYIDPPILGRIFGLVALSGIALSVYLTAFIVQLFFASRVWIVSNSNLFWVIPIVVLSLLQLGAGIAQVATQTRLSGLDLFRSSVEHTTLQSAATAAADIVITIALCRSLNNARSGVKKTDSVIDKLVKYAIHRGAATSFAALASLILFPTVTRAPAFLIPFLASGQLYAISVISMLQSRGVLQNLLHDRPEHEGLPVIALSSRNK